jgi:chitodextrinase
MTNQYTRSFIGTARPVKAVLLSILLLAVSACGGGGGGGNNGGNNGNNGGSAPSQPAPQPPASSGTALDVAGDWNVTENITSNCPGDPNHAQYLVSITQNGDNLTVFAGGQSFSGKLQGNSVSWTGSFPEDGGTTTITDLKLNLSGDGNSLTGTSKWTWSDGSDSCSGVSQVSANRVNPLDTTPPTAPTNLSVTPGSSSALNLAWSASTDDTGVTGYKIYRDGVELRAVTGTNASDSGLTVNVSYCYQVAATDAAGNESIKSAQKCVLVPQPADAAAPTVPANLSAEAVSPFEVSLTWSASTDNVGVTRYKVYRGKSLISVVAATDATDTNVQPDLLFCYQVSAVDAANNESSRSVEACVQTPRPSDTTAPSTPTGLTGSVLSASEIRLSWNASTDDVGVAGYKVYRDGAFVRTVTQRGTTDLGLSANTQYCYEVSAIDDAANESGKTAQVCRTTSKSGPVLTGPGNSTGTFTLTWTYQWPALVSNQYGYVLEESTTSASSGFAQILSTENQGVADVQSPRSHTLTRAAGSYYYRVRGTGSGFSNVVAVTVSAPSVLTLTANPSADNTIFYSTADANAANTSYPNGDISVGCNWNYGAYQNDWVCAETLLKFNVQTQIAGKTIVSAKLRLYPYILPANLETTYAASAMAGSWSPTTLTFANRPQHYLGGTAFADPPVTIAVPVEFDVTTIAQFWADGGANNGIAVYDTDYTFPWETALRATSFYSSNVSSSSAKVPQLYIEYQ